MKDKNAMPRTIKSFVLRGGRISPRQQRALEEWLGEYALPVPTTPWCFKSVFGRVSEVMVEIGFGMGASLLEMAKNQPHKDFIGIEVHRAGIGSLVASLHEEGVTNVRVAPYDAVAVFQTAILDNTLSGIHVFFPDPWPKKRHHKRRLIQPSFVHILAKKLQLGGFIHCATDWEAYAAFMLSVLSKEPLLENQGGEGFISRPATRPLTKFEERGHRLGHAVMDLLFKRQAI